MRLYVMRHGPAGQRGDVPNDFERPLTAEGTRETTAACAGLARLKLQPLTILTSPLTRALQTAELAAECLTPGQPPRVVDALASGATPGEILKGLSGVPGDILIAGHDPDFSAFVSYVLIGETNSFIDFAKGGVAAIEFRRAPERGAGMLLWYMRRKHLSLLAQR